MVKEAGGFVTDFNGENAYIQNKTIVATNSKINKEMIGILNQDLGDLFTNQFNAGTTGSVSEFLDIQPPIVFINEPNQNEIVSGIVVVKGSASDNINLEYVEVRLLPNDWERANGFESWAWSWNSSKDLNGRYTIEARSFDGYNFSSVFSIDVEVTNEGSNRRPTAYLNSNINESSC